MAGADSVRIKRYADYQSWYDGKHWPRPRAGRTNLVVNYCHVLVDKSVSYLFGKGLNFAVKAGSDEANLPAANAEAAEALIYRVYEDSNLEAVDVQAGTNAAVLGDCVFKVFWDKQRRLPRVINQDPTRFFCSWAEDDLATLLRAHCSYRLSPEVAELRFGKPFRGTSLDVVESWTADTFEVWAGDQAVSRVANPYGFIPFVHIPNARPANEFWGVSDLKDLIPLNKELNERFSDFADVVRYHSDPPVIFKGVSEHSNLAVGAGTVWDIPEGADVELLEWKGQQPATFEHVDRIMRAMHDIAETPKTAFGETGRLQSGVALEIELESLIQKTIRKRGWWSAGLRQRNAMILRIGERMGLGRFAPYRSRVVWPPLLPSDAEVDVRNNVALVQAGLRSRQSAMDRLGEESPEEELRLIDRDRGPQGGTGTVLGAESRVLGAG